MPKQRIRKKIPRFKSKIDNYLNSDKVITINNIETQAVKQQLICESFDDYINNKINGKNMIYSVIVCIISFIMVLRLLLGAFTTDPNIWILIGDPFYLVGDRVLINISLAIFGTIGIKCRMIFILRKFYSLRFTFKIKIETCFMLKNLFIEIDTKINLK
jgi:hypothetical protein